MKWPMEEFSFFFWKDPWFNGSNYFLWLLIQTVWFSYIEMFQNLGILILEGF